MHLRCHTGPPSNPGMKDSKDAMLTTQKRGFSQGFEQTAQGSLPSEQPDGSVHLHYLSEGQFKYIEMLTCSLLLKVQKSTLK